VTVEVDDTIERNIINGVGPYPFSFRIFDATDLQVTACSLATPAVTTLLTYPADYTVAGVNDEDGGSVTLDSGAASIYDGDTLDIRSNTQNAQPTSIRNQGRFLPEIHENALDNLSRQIQDLRRVVRACLRYPDNGLLDGTLTPVSAYASKILTFDANGAPLPAVLSASTVTASTITSLMNASTTDQDALLALMMERSDTSPGLTSLKRTAAEIAASVTPVNYAYPPGDLRRYGCDTTGATDNSTQIQNAIAAARASGGVGYIYHPGGNIAHSSQILFGPGLTVYGQDRSACVFTYTGTGSAWRFSNNGTNTPTPNNSSFGRVIIVGIKIATASASNTGAALELNACGAAFNIVRSCWLSGTFKYGLILDGTIVTQVHHNIIDNSGPANPANIWIVNGPDRSVGQGTGWSNVISIKDNQCNTTGDNSVCIIDDGGSNHQYKDNNLNGAAISMAMCSVSGFKIEGTDMENAGVQQANSIANVFFTDATYVSSTVRTACENGVIQNNGFNQDMLAGSTLVFGSSSGAVFHRSIVVQANNFRFNLGISADIDVTKLANSFCGFNKSSLTGARDHYAGTHNDANGNTLLAPQNGYAGLFANAAVTYGDTRYPYKFHGGSDFDTTGGLAFAGHKLNQFTIEIKNNAGTLQHRICTSHMDGAQAISANLIRGITGASASFQNTPTVSSGAGFGGVGAGITSGSIYFDTNAQTRASNWSTAVIEYYDGNAQRVRAAVGFDSTNINGVTRSRLAISLTDDMAGTAASINATLLPAGKTIAIKVFAGVA
jgi:hypothetical protein